MLGIYDINTIFKHKTYATQVQLPDTICPDWCAYPGFVGIRSLSCLGNAVRFYVHIIILKCFRYLYVLNMVWTDQTKSIVIFVRLQTMTVPLTVSHEKNQNIASLNIWQRSETLVPGNVVSGGWNDDIYPVFFHSSPFNVHYFVVTFVVSRNDL